MPAMETSVELPRDHLQMNLPSTPKADGAQEDKKPPRAQRRAREVSSRYMMVVTSPSAPPPPSSACAASSTCPPLPPPPPRKPQPKQKPCPPPTPQADAQRARARRSPSPQARCPRTPSSLEVGDSDGEGSAFGDENRPEAPPPVSRSTDALIPSMATAGTERRRAVRLFREIGEDRPPSPPPPPLLSEPRKLQQSLNSRIIDSRFLTRKPRPGTPVVHLPERGAAAAVTPRPPVEVQTLARPANPRTTSRTTRSQVSRSLQDTLAGTGQPHRVPFTPAPVPDRETSIWSVETSPEHSTVTDFSEAEETCSISSPGALCDSPPINHGGRSRMNSECRTSMPETDLLPAMFSRLTTEGNSCQLDSSHTLSISHRGSSASLCHRSLNSALSGCQQRLLNPAVSMNRLPTTARTPSSPARGEMGCLPSQATAGKMPGYESRKGRKMSNRPEDAHALRLLENRYLQWRFVNARAQASVQARKVAAERLLCGASARLSELYASVVRKRIELGRLRNMRTVSAILETQMPCLQDWAMLEDEYSSSLCGAIKSLQDASLRVPLIGNVKANEREVVEVLNSATDVLESLTPRVSCFEAKADGLQTVQSDLAKVVGEERALVEEFGDLLSEAHKLEVYESSLRIHLIQLKRANTQIIVES